MAKPNFVVKVDGGGEMVDVADLDQDGVVIGTKRGRRESVPHPNLILPPNHDVPLDGTFKWHDGQKCFMPLGMGFSGHIDKPLHDFDHSLFEMVRLLQAQKINVGPGMEEWADWYERNEKKKAEVRQGFRARLRAKPHMKGN